MSLNLANTEASCIKRPAVENAESLLELLSHHCAKNAVQSGPLGVPDAQKVAWRNIPDGAGNPSDDEDDDLQMMQCNSGGGVLLGGDSDVESGGDSDLESLQSAGVWTDVETVKMHLAHLSKLKSAYQREFDSLRHLMRESRRQYLRDVAGEKQTMASIHSQAKSSVSERKAYEELKALLRYQKHNGKQALMRHSLLEKRNATNIAESSSLKDRPMKQSKFCCVYSQGSWKCGERAVPMARHCVKHILEDPQQMLYRACGSDVGGGDPCHIPIIPLPHKDTCIYHTPLPQHLVQQSASETDNNKQEVEAINTKDPPVIQLTDSATILVLPVSAATSIDIAAKFVTTADNPIPSSSTASVITDATAAATSSNAAADSVGVAASSIAAATASAAAFT
uniref:KAT8 regulatory NSL complex subunit 2 n=1 Tax=Hirondellea gigas TaxID=1518452 RepID=A0A2P2HZP1_9CRUS